MNISVKLSLIIAFITLFSLTSCNNCNIYENTTLENPAPNGSWVRYSINGGYSILNDGLESNGCNEMQTKITDIKYYSKDSEFIDNLIDKYNKENISINQIKFSDLSENEEFMAIGFDIKVNRLIEGSSYFIPIPISYQLKSIDKDLEYYSSYGSALQNYDEEIKQGDTVHTYVIFKSLKNCNDFIVCITGNMGEGMSDFKIEYLSLK